MSITNNLIKIKQRINKCCLLQNGLANVILFAVYIKKDIL